MGLLPLTNHWRKLLSLNYVIFDYYTKMKQGNTLSSNKLPKRKNTYN